MRLYDKTFTTTNSITVRKYYKAGHLFFLGNIHLKITEFVEKLLFSSFFEKETTLLSQNPAMDTNVFSQYQTILNKTNLKFCFQAK